jgi:hypothetical protein
MQEWEKHYVPALTTLRETWNRLLIDRSQKRKDEWNDDYIGGCIATLDAILTMPEAIIGEADDANNRKEEARRETKAYETRSKLGRIGPFIGDDSFPRLEE